jgi:hypothetical protein
MDALSKSAKYDEDDDDGSNGVGSTTWSWKMRENVLALPPEDITGSSGVATSKSFEISMMRWESIPVRVGVVVICAGVGWESIAFVLCLCGGLEFGWVYFPAVTKSRNCTNTGIFGSSRRSVVSDSNRGDTKARPEFDPAIPHFPTPSFMLHIASGAVSSRTAERVHVLNFRKRCCRNLHLAASNYTFDCDIPVLQSILWSLHV